ncbi:hypothetical protein EMIT0111MI5_70017 [Burkholderia sp. IT-111MI5]
MTFRFAPRFERPLPDVAQAVPEAKTPAACMADEGRRESGPAIQRFRFLHPGVLDSPT